MEDEMVELKEEISFLKKRIEILEKINNRRKAYSYFKLLVKLCLILLTLYGIWRGYGYVKDEIPKLIDNKIKEINPFKSNKVE